MKELHVIAETNSVEKAPYLGRGIVLLLAVACGISVANLYYAQPLLADIARDFRVSQGAIGIVATLTQLGYATGLLLIVPLGDAFDRRNLTTITLFAVTLALVATALAPSLPILAITSYAVGVTTIVPQIIIPFAASLARPEERGRVVGMIMSGLLIGILLARTVSGFLGARLGWRAMYWIAAGLMILLLLVLRALLPKDRPGTSISYPRLLRSLWDFIRDEPVLREASVFGGLAFGAFSAFWVTLVFFLGTAPYHYGSDVAGLFGLVGVVGALAASLVGKWADRVEARRITGGMLLIALAAFVVFWLAGSWLWGLIVGVILLDFGTQGAHISNQSRIFALNPGASSRLNTVYMTSYFVGGSLGSMLGSYGWSVARWNGVCFVGVVLVVLAIFVYVRGTFAQKRR